MASLGSIWSKLVPGRGVSQREAKVGITKQRFPSGSVASGTKASLQKWAKKFDGKLVCLSRNGKLITYSLPNSQNIKACYYQDRNRMRLATESEIVLARLAKKDLLEGMDG